MTIQTKQSMENDETSQNINGFAWWENFFEDPLIQEFWSRIVPESHTAMEVDFVVKALTLSPAARLLDAPCGDGRHLLGFAAMGFEATGIDRSVTQLSLVREKLTQKGLNAKLVQVDLRHHRFQGEFDGACCLGASFGYHDDDENEAFLRGIASALKPGAGLVLDAPIVAETALYRFTGQHWYPMGDEHLLIRYSYDLTKSRLHEEITVIQPGRQIKRRADYKIYLFRDLAAMLDRAGFTEVVAFGGTDFRPYETGQQECLIVAHKS